MSPEYPLQRQGETIGSSLFSFSSQRHILQAFILFSFYFCFLIFAKVEGILVSSLITDKPLYN